MPRLRYVLLLLLTLPASAFAQGPNRFQVIAATHHDVSPPLRDLPPGPRYFGVLEAEPVRRIPSSRIPTSSFDPVLQRMEAGPSALAAPATVVNIDGIGNGFSGPSGTFFVNAAPPDTNGAVGPNHFVETVNTDFAVFNKAGAVVFGPVTINTLWSGFGGNCQTHNDGDPVVSYDRIADRWIITQFQVSVTPFQQCVAISTGPDPTGSYYRYVFSYTDGFPDYPKLGVWPDAYYISYNVFNNAGTAFLYSKACAFDRARMLTGAAATQQCFNTSSSFGGLLPADLDGQTLPAAGAPNPFVALGATSTTLALWKFHSDFTTPANATFTGPTTVTVPSYTEACGFSGTCIPQSGGGALDSLSDRLMYRAAYRNRGSYEALVVNHSVTVGTSVGVRWYELRSITTTPQLFQSGTFAPDAKYRWMGSMAMDQSGNIALGYSVSSSSTKPEIRYTGRLAGDAAGTMTQGEGTIIAGGGAQGSSLSRWGDYSSLSVDPVDDCTFWYSNEYIPSNGTFNWRTRIASFKLSPCGSAQDFSLSAAPSSVSTAPGGSTSSTITVTPTGGFTGGVALSISGVPFGATASFSPATTTSTSVLTLDAGTAASGTYALTVQGTSGSLTHTTTVSFTITPNPDFSLSASPSSLTVAQGTSGTTTITVAPLNGFAGSVTLSASGLPAGATGTFAPVTTATTSVLTINAGTAAPGSYPVTITGTSGSLTRTVPITLTVPIPNFSLTASPSTVTVAPGGGGTTTITVNPSNGFSGTVSLSASGVPAGASAGFSPVDTTSTSVLTLNAGTAAPGTYTLTIAGISGALTRNTTVTFVVTAPGSFSISASPASRTVSRRSSTTYAITITRTGGFSGVVTLAVSGMNQGVTGSFNPSSVSGTSSTLTITAANGARRGQVTLTITGTSAGLPNATTTVTLTVN